MRWRLLFFASLVVNFVLAVSWFVTSRHRTLTREGSAEFGRSTNNVKTNYIVRRQFFSWSEVEAADYPTYISNLRSIGCPEQTIRDIIIADVNALFAKQIATNVLTPDQQWWRTEPDPEVAAAAAERLRDLEEDRRTLLTQLLGPAWEGGDLVSLPRPTRPGVALDGPVLGIMPVDVKQAVEDASVRANDRLQAYLDAQRLAGKQPDPAEIAKLRQEARTEFAHLLTPPQLEEFLLRYSQSANNLRSEMGDLKYFDATPDEFRAIFHATDPIDQQLELLAGKTDANSVLLRNQLLQQRDNAIKVAVGADRYRMYQMLHDPQFRDAVAKAQEAGDPDAALQLYQINQNIAQQLASIRANTNLTAEQQAIAIKQAELDQMKSNAVALGQPLPPQETNAAPPAPQPPPFTPVTHSYVLGVAESPVNVASRYGVSVQALQAANPGVDLRRLKAGDSIKIPTRVLAPTGVTPMP
jgi:LysM repeat protein